MMVVQDDKSWKWHEKLCVCVVCVCVRVRKGTGNTWSCDFVFVAVGRGLYVRLERKCFSHHVWWTCSATLWQTPFFVCLNVYLHYVCLEMHACRCVLTWLCVVCIKLTSIWQMTACSRRSEPASIPKRAHRVMLRTCAKADVESVFHGSCLVCVCG